MKVTITIDINEKPQPGIKVINRTIGDIEVYERAKKNTEKEFLTVNDIKKLNLEVAGTKE